MASNPIIEQYVADLSVMLPGPKRWRVGVLDEVRDSLLEGSHTHDGTEHDRAVAALHAIEEHGSIDVVARAYAPELAAAWVRRVGAVALAIIPAMAIAWNVALEFGPTPSWDQPGSVVRIAAILIGSGIACVTFVCSITALLGTGRLVAAMGKYLPTFRLAVCSASAAVSFAVLALLGVATARAVAAPSSLDWPGILTAYFLSLITLTALTHNVSRCINSVR
jgi:hypothetical protein